MYRFMSKQFIALFAGLLVLCSIQFISPPKMRGLILRRKTGTVSVEVFTFHVHLAFERHPETELVHQLRGLRGSLTGNKRNLYNLNL